MVEVVRRGEVKRTNYFCHRTEKMYHTEGKMECVRERKEDEEIGRKTEREKGEDIGSNRETEI